ncbi:WD40-repeat-containing domain protein [Bisporella sp. PMI_857]|nr:WD40-repeat-containing domain protein [Bisporella sp. PMI_857]
MADSTDNDRAVSNYTESAATTPATVTQSEDTEYMDGMEDDEPFEVDEDEDETLLEVQDFIEQIIEEQNEDGGEFEDEDLGDFEIELSGNAMGGTTEQQRALLMQLIRHANIRQLLRTADIEEDDDGIYPRFRLRTRPRTARDPFPEIPSEKGSELMGSGEFGSNEAEITEDLSVKKKKNLALRILNRELATESFTQQKLNHRLLAQGMLPSSNADMIIHYNQPVYSGQFSDDGNFFFSVNKDFRVRMYDTSNPYHWRYYKTVDFPYGQWTLTDASLSPDNRYLAYTSIRSTVCLAPTDPNDQGDPYILDLGAQNTGQNPYRQAHRIGSSFGIWSIRFSGDGRRLVAGATEGKIVVYDIESRAVLHTFDGHDEDVNAVCFADKTSPHIVYSGSDDNILKVWDTRSMGGDREVGAFVGHIEGLTYIDSKGDGRYILSNGKDQSMKLWDLRMVMSRSDFKTMTPDPRTIRNRQNPFDYRWGAYDEDDWYQHRNDNSIVTFRGHRVLRTLIRCHFSPPGSTNSRYVYSGSEDGKVYVWNMDATLAGTIDVQAATRNSRPPHRGYHMMNAWNEDQGRSAWKTCVRDASWHPSAPMIVASAWNGYGMSTGTCTVHSWNDGAEEDEAEPKMGYRVDPKLVPDPALYEDQDAPRRGPRARIIRV